MSQQLAAPRVGRGRVVYSESSCAVCHKISGTGGSTGPSLDEVDSKHDAGEMEGILHNPQNLNPNTVMPPFNGSDLEALVAYLISLK